ncbi:MAG: glycerate kinase [Chloroflexi bacterium]|nr:glycerate kinase [Chloroflexota bacterium]
MQTRQTRLSPPRAHQSARSVVEDLLRAALAAADPAAAVAATVEREGHWLHVGRRVYDLRRGRVVVVGAGKAAAPMAVALQRIPGLALAAGLVVVKDGHGAPTARVAIREAAHPLPDERGVRATRALLDLVADLGPDDLVLCVLSGGGSALLVAPAPGVTLADKQQVTDQLLRAGATIGELNAVRKHLSAVKGGQLARAAAPAQVACLIISDVVGDPLDVVASGPTVPDPTTFAAALAVLRERGLLASAPPAVIARLEQGAAGHLPETPKPGDPLFERVENVLVATNAEALDAAADRARALGFHALVLSASVEGEAREVGRVLAALAREEAARGRPAPLPACLLAGGETTVAVRGEGLGGRNQELVLAAALALEGLPAERAVVASVATDGGDGPTPAAGALADGGTVARAAALGLDARAALRGHDSHPLLKAVDGLVVTGPTRTNVNDVMMVLAWPDAQETRSSVG